MKTKKDSGTFGRNIWAELKITNETKPNTINDLPYHGDFEQLNSSGTCCWRNLTRMSTCFEGTCWTGCVHQKFQKYGRLFRISKCAPEQKTISSKILQISPNCSWICKSAEIFEMFQIRRMLLDLQGNRIWNITNPPNVTGFARNPVREWYIRYNDI